MRRHPTARRPVRARSPRLRAVLAPFAVAALALAWTGCVDFAEETVSDGAAADTADAAGADGGGEPIATPACPEPFTWLDLTAISADRVGRPSVYDERDTRAGSLDIHLNGGQGFGGNEADPAYAAGFLTLRNGGGDILEELQLNRRYKPMRLGADGCALDSRFPQCWVDVPDDPGGGTLEIGLPYQVEDSNVDFDRSGERVSVEGSVRIALGEKPPSDSAHQTVHVTWEAPTGLADARLLLRGSYRTERHDAEAATTWVVPMLTIGWAERGSGLEVSIPVVEEVERTDTRLTVALNGEEVMRYLCGFANGCDAHGAARLELTGSQALWTVTNDGETPVSFDALVVTWPAENGALEELRLGRRVLLREPAAAGPLHLRLADMPEVPVVAPGRTTRLTMKFTNPVARDSGAYYVRFDSLDGCMVELAHRSCRISPSECLGRRLPLVLTLAYIGTNCGASTYAQDRSGVTCDGDPKFASPVRVVATDADEPVDTAAPWFDDVVERGERFALDPATLGRPALPERTRVEVFTPEGERLHTVSFATGCGVSLIEGDLFGAIRLAGCDVPDGEAPPADGGDADGDGGGVE